MTSCWQPKHNYPEVGEKADRGRWLPVATARVQQGWDSEQTGPWLFSCHWAQTLGEAAQTSHESLLLGASGDGLSADAACKM